MQSQSRGQRGQDICDWHMIDPISFWIEAFGVREVRPSWRGGALLRWQPTSHGSGALSLIQQLFDTCLMV
jgi:hypothetical protein